MTCFKILLSYHGKLPCVTIIPPISGPKTKAELDVTSLLRNMWHYTPRIRKTSNNQKLEGASVEGPNARDQIAFYAIK